MKNLITKMKQQLPLILTGLLMTGTISMCVYQIWTNQDKICELEKEMVLIQKEVKDIEKEVDRILVNLGAVEHEVYSQQIKPFLSE